MIKINKKLAKILTAAMLVAMLSGTALATEGTDYDIWCNGQRFSDDNLTITCGSGFAVYDPEAKTLILTNATIDTGCELPEDFEYTYGTAGIFTLEDISIILVGENSIEDTGGTGIDSYMDGAQARVEVSGSGSLTINQISTPYDSYGFSLASLTLDGVKLYISSACTGIWTESELVIKDSVVVITNTQDNYFGIVVNGGNAEINGSVLVGNKQPLALYGITGDSSFFSFQDGFDYVLSNDSMIITCDTAAGPFTAGVDTGIISNPAGIAVWGVSDGKGGISYKNGKLSGTVAIPGASVNQTPSRSDPTNSSAKPYTIINGTAVMTPTKAEIDRLLRTAVNGVVTVDFSAASEISALDFEVDPKWFDGEGDSLRFILPSGIELIINDEMWPELIIKAAGGKVKFSFTNGSAILAISQDGKTLNWYNYQHPIIIAIPSDSKNSVMIDKISGSIIPRSWYVAGKVYAKVYSTGAYDAKTVTITSFADTAGRWMDAAAGYMAARGVIKGVGDNLFAPSRNITRAEFVTMLMRMVNINVNTSSTAPFADAAANSYYYDSLLKAKALGLVAGIGNSSFAPHAEITRQDMFVMLYRAMVKLDMIAPSKAGIEVQAYSDYKDIAAYAEEALLAFVQQGLVAGKGDNLLVPRGIATRAEAVQLLYNVLACDAE